MENPIIQVEQGKLCGVVENNVYGIGFTAFRGIPYGKAPVGDLRFKDPEPVEPWSGIKDATQFGSKCAQNDWFQKEIVGSEDCLYLNVYTSDINSSDPRAVMVWIHGGGFIFGSGEDDLYGPDHLIEKDIVLVTINYRLGLLGFLDLEDEETTGNQGLKDQVLALKWIQQNISKFGGDPHNVTIFGESAGGASVHYLTLSPLAEGLFHKAIMQSGVAINPWASAAQSIKKNAQKLSAILGKEITDSKMLVEFLRTIDIHQLLEAEALLQTWKEKLLFISLFVPSMDSKSKNPFMPIPIQDAVKAGVKVPCMIGYVADEGMIFLMNDKLSDDKMAEIDANPENFLLHPNIEAFLKEKNISAEDIKQVFMGNDKIATANMKKVINLMSALTINIGLHRVIEIQALIPDISTYMYKFVYEYENALAQKLLKIDVKGTCHLEEINFLFYPKVSKMLGLELPERDSTQHIITQRFVELWTNFAKTGHPTPETSVLIPIKWKPVDNPEKYKCMKISEDLCMIKDPNILLEIEKKLEEIKA